MAAVSRFVLSFVFVALLHSTAYAAARSIEYSSEAFAEAQAAGQTIVVDVFANWCPTCQAQQPILEELKADADLADALFVQVNYDQHKDFLRTHRIPRQSVILVFRGEEEVARSIAETDRDRLREVVLTAAAG
ncbi:MAG: thioredoxin [Rhodospirillales bacterium]|nr:MAG: thioredoxin [Rhodospirillales bacterium]